jgi:capsid portal protein
VAKRERDSKGRFVANSTTSTINRKASGRLKFDIVNLAPMPDIKERQHNLTSKEIYEFGEDNLFPQYLAELKRKSSTHRAILSQKATYTAGSKITTINAKLQDYINEVNPSGQSLRNLFRLVVDDFYTFGNAYIEFVEYDGGVNMYHVDSTMVRVGKNMEKVFINPDWTHYDIKDKKVRTLPMFPNFRNGRSVLMFKDYESGFQRYGIPDYIAAAESGSIEIDYLIQKYNRSKFENGFMPSAIIEIDGSMSDSEAEELISLAQDKLTGEDNNGKILFLVKDGVGAGGGANVQILKDDKDGSFMEYQELTRNNIVTAHRWQPALSGIVSSGKMNNTGSEIRISYDLVMRTVIQDTIEQVFKPMRDALGKVLKIDASSLEVQFESPIGFAADIDITKIADVNELRALIGLEERPDLDDVYLEDLKATDNGSDRL